MCIEEKYLPSVCPFENKIHANILRDIKVQKKKISHFCDLSLFKSCTEEAVVSYSRKENKEK